MGSTAPPRQRHTRCYGAPTGEVQREETTLAGLYQASSTLLCLT